MRHTYAFLGWMALGFAILGAMLPLLPTTIFVIIAAACFAKSSPKMEAYLLDHRVFGPSLRAWRDHGAISKRGKLFSILGILLGFVFAVYTASPPVWVLTALTLTLVSVALFILTRPSPPIQR
ncbi:MAG: YbaN family protein [Pseudomonadota bacterium]